MKNIHVIPTDKPSRLFITDNKLFNYHKPQQGDSVKIINQNIYITNSEEIKEGDYYLTQKNTICKCIKIDNKYVYSLEGGSSTNCKKIILTTDQDLIKDGVQAIDDEFLKWFVMNPSCENVTVLQKGTTTIIFPTPKSDIISNFIKKEEPKERLEKYSERFDNKDNEIVQGVFNPENWGKRLVKEPKQKTLENDTDSEEWGFENFITSEEDAKIFIDTMIKTPEPNEKLKKAFREYGKQETLEEAAMKMYPIKTDPSGYDINMFSRYGFYNGAKWQQEQDKKLYSEEDMMKAVKFGELYKSKNSKSLFEKRGTTPTEVLKKWFEQFKNK